MVVARDDVCGYINPDFSESSNYTALLAAYELGHELEMYVKRPGG